jgi:hypothetical protein
MTKTREEWVRDILDGLPLNGTGPDPDLHAASRIDWAELWTAEDTDEWLIEPVMARGRGHALYAPAKAGKSLLLLYIAGRAATGRAVLGRPAGEPVRIVYCDLEMTRDDVRERLGDMGFGSDDNLEALAYYSLPSLPPLDSAQGGVELVDLAVAHRADLVIVDTLGRAVVGEENRSDTLRDFARYTGLPLKAAGVACCRADHAGKDLDRGQRGTSGKVDDVDVVWRLTPRDRGRFDLVCTHRRAAWFPQTVHLDQSTDPLAYKLVEDSWPAGTRQVADLLDRLGVPLDNGKGKARAAIKAAGETASNEALMAALRWRRSLQAVAEQLPGDPS